MGFSSSSTPARATIGDPARLRRVSWLGAVAYFVGDGDVLGSVPESFLSGRDGRGAGSATPMEMMYFNASSTLMSSAMVSDSFTTRKNPAVMFGVVGTKTAISSAPNFEAS